MCGCCGRVQMGWYDRKVRRVRDLSCGDTRIFLELEVRRLDCRNGGKVKRERLDFLADNPLYTKRFAYFVGRRCRQASIADVAKELALDWHTVKALEMQYMEAQLARVGRPGPQVIGIDEIAIRKGHTYRIVVSDLRRGRPIWFGGDDRSEASMAQFDAWLGARKAAEAVREVRRHDRPSLGRHRGLLPAGQQGLARLRRGAQQQDPGDPAARLRPARQGLPAAQDPHLHAAHPVADSTPFR